MENAYKCTLEIEILIPEDCRYFLGYTNKSKEVDALLAKFREDFLSIHKGKTVGPDEPRAIRIFYPLERE